MSTLDYKTLENIADLICGDKLSEKYCEDSFNCPFYRKGFQLPTFFRSAGLKCPDHDGSTRNWWTLNRLEIYNNEDKLDLVLKRIANPKEYGDMQNTLIVIKELNNLIAVEGLEIELNGVKPVILNKNATVPHKKSTMTSLLKIDFNEFINDKSLVFILNSRWKEVENCINSKAFLAAIILMGSILEGVLLYVIENNEEKAKLSKEAPHKHEEIKNIDKWTLYDLIVVSHDCKWLDKDIKDFDHNLRDYRNLVHPRKQRDEEFYPDEDTCKICLEVVKAAMNDVMNNNENINSI